MKAQNAIKGPDPLFNHGAKWGGGWSTPRPSRSTPGKRPDTHDTGRDPTKTLAEFWLNVRKYKISPRK